MQRNAVRKNQQRLMFAEVYIGPPMISGTSVYRQELVFWYPFDWKALDGFKVLITTQNQERFPRYTS
jgi:hypothetical protein